MTIVVRTSLKAYFETGDLVTAASFVDLIDSCPNLAEASVQAFSSEISSPQFVAAEVSASGLGVAGVLNASAATIGGPLRQGVSAATSASDTRGYILVVQETTVTNATAQVAFLPTTSNIAGFGIKVLVGGSAAAGGLNVLVGAADDHRRFAKISVSAVGVFEGTNVSALALTGVSGRVEMVASGASAGTNIVGFVKYFQRA